MVEPAAARLAILGPAAVLACLASLLLIVLLRPALARYALAHPNARPSPTTPTPQGGGGPVVAAALITTWGALVLAPGALRDAAPMLAAVTAAALLLAALGMADDLHGL